MKTFVPAYYKSFHCISSECRHTCCAGWEIDVDEDTLELYHSLSSDSLNILNHIEYSDGNSYIALDQNERCPFLNKNGLCKIIQKYGESAISDICYEHPRFRNYFSDHTEMGIGMTCEEASRIILASSPSLSFYELENDENTEKALTPEESSLLEYRQKLFENVIVSYSEYDINAYDIQFLRSLESMLPEWQISLLYLQNPKVRNLPEEKTATILNYFLFRHLPSSLSTMYSKEQYASFSYFSVSIIKGIYDRSELAIEEISREYSTEIEYSDENIGKIIDYLTEKELSRD